MITVCIVLETILLIVSAITIFLLHAANTKLADTIKNQQSYMEHQQEVLQQSATEKSHTAEAKMQQVKSLYQQALQKVEDAKLIYEKNNALENRIRQLQSELYRARQKAKRHKSKSLGSN